MTATMCLDDHISPNTFGVEAKAKPSAYICHWLWKVSDEPPRTGLAAMLDERTD